MSHYQIVTGKTIENLNANIEDFLKKNPKYKPYNQIYNDTPNCEPIRYQSFVKYGKTNKYNIVKGKTMEELNRNIEIFFQKNPGYQPYNQVYYTEDNCENTRYQSFVKYGKRKSHRKRIQTKRMHKQKTYKKRN